MKRSRALVAIPAVTLLLAVAAATPAMADADTLQVGPQATLVAKGVAVDVSISYACTPASEWSENTGTIRVTQVVRGQQVAGADGSFAPVCDGTSRSAVARVTVNAGSAPFKTGTGLVNASLTMGDMMSPTITLSTSQQVRIAR